MCDRVQTKMPAAKTDSNQAAIVAMLRTCGATVCLLHTVGRGVPDLLVGYRGHNLLVEVKTAAGKLNELQESWHNDWRGTAVVIKSTESVLPLLAAITGVAPLAGWSTTTPTHEAITANAIKRFRARYQTKEL